MSLADCFQSHLTRSGRYQDYLPVTNVLFPFFWAGEVTPTKSKEVTVKEYSDGDITLAKGEEMGRFNMGSTVILLMPPGALKGLENLGAGDAVKVGQRLGTL